MYDIIALVGPAGCGKDTLVKRAIAADPTTLAPILHYTTRPRRANEQDGVDYKFIAEDEFARMVLQDKMVECATFNNWFYGTARDSLSSSRINIGTFSPAALEALLSNLDIRVAVFEIQTEDRLRLIRQLSRDEKVDVNEVLRRYKADKEDFFDLTDLQTPINVCSWITLKNNDLSDLELNIDKIIDLAHKMLLGKSL